MSHLLENSTEKVPSKRDDSFRRCHNSVISLT
jgi:hypothetical protein